MEILFWIFILYVLPIIPTKNIIAMCVQTMEINSDWTENPVLEKIVQIFKNYPLHFIPIFNLVVFVSFFLITILQHLKFKNDE